MTHLLVGFVNQIFASSLHLAALNTETGALAWIRDDEIAAATGSVKGVAGILRLDEHWIVGYQSSPTRFVVFDKAFRPVSSFVSRDVLDVHAFAMHDGELHCVSTGSDAVVAIALDDDFQPLGTRRVWSVDGAVDGVDAHHVNSIAQVDGELLVTMFGRKSVEGWGKTRNGRLVRVRDGAVLKEGLFHPHTAQELDGTWMVCASGDGRVHLADGRAIEHRGYLRGIAVTERHIFVGKSGRRLRSKSENRMIDGVPPEELSRSAVLAFDRQTLDHVATYPTSLFGVEIFDLDVIPDASSVARFFEMDPRDAVIERMQEKIYDLSRERHVTTLGGVVRRDLVRAVRNVAGDRPLEVAAELMRRARLLSRRWGVRRGGSA